MPASQTYMYIVLSTQGGGYHEAQPHSLLPILGK